jgi:hypothetical protein
MRPQSIGEELTTVDDLEEIAKQNKIKLNGIYSRDRIDIDKIQKAENSNNIINLDSAMNSGSHWVALMKRGPVYIYFDSFGIPPPQEIINSCPKLYYNDVHIQDLDYGYCGQYCIAFIGAIGYPETMDELFNNYENFMAHFDIL